MRLTDYLRLGLAGVKAHKKRAFAVVIIVGLLFGVLMAGAFILQGAENVVLAEMLAPTDGEVLMMSSIESVICGEECDVAAEVEVMKRKVEEYGGETVEAKVTRIMGEEFYILEEGVLGDAATGDIARDESMMAVMVPLKVAVEMAEMELPDWTANVTKRVQAISRVREEVLGKVVENENGDKYRIVEILPSAVYVGDLSLRNIGQRGNLLNAILDLVPTGESLNFVVGEIEEMVGAEMDDGVVETEELGAIFAKFPGVEGADKYYRDKVNYCSEVDRMFSTYNKGYRYRTVAAIADPLGVYEKFQDIWLVYKIIVAVLAVIGVMIALSTYVRLIGKDVKVVALYHALGATGWQIRMVYVVYLLILSGMAAGFAAMIGLMLAVGVSLVNMEAMEQVFALGFGVTERAIWLVGWNDVIWWLTGVMLLTAVVTVVLGNGNFTSRELARKMK